MTGDDGAYGLEYNYDDTLSGTNGRIYSYYNEELGKSQEIELPTNGNNIVTSIDSNVQRIVQRWLFLRGIVAFVKRFLRRCATLQVYALAARHTPYPRCLLGRKVNLLQLLTPFPQSHQHLLQQVVHIQPLPRIAAADGKEHPAVAAHQLVKCLLFLHTIITNFGSKKLQVLVFSLQFSGERRKSYRLIGASDSMESRMLR